MEPLRRVEALRRWREVAEAILPTLKKHGVECYAFGSAVAGRVTGSSDLDILLFVEEEDLHSAEVLAEAEAVLGELAYLLDIKVARIEDREKPPYVWFLRNAVRLC
ncbi:MAG: nucleotidyltransferase domain-containing protein [Thermoproteus sp.]